MTTMKAALVREFGAPLTLGEVPKPMPRPTDVVVKVEACSLVQNLTNVLTNYANWFPFLPLPKLPAIFGLDVSGVVDAVGAQVRGVKPGDRVYVNPARSCGSCAACRAAQPTACPSFTFQGYFGFGPGSVDVFEDYPAGGLAEFMTAPVSSLVKLDDRITFEQGARFGYIGTAYGALKKAHAGSGKSLAITGATGTLGVPTVLLALAMGVTKIFAVARDKTLLERLKGIDPRRVHILSYGERPVEEWIRSHTDGAGADIFIDALSSGARAQVTMDGLRSLRRGGIGVCIGA